MFSLSFFNTKDSENILPEMRAKEERQEKFSQPIKINLHKNERTYHWYDGAIRCERKEYSITFSEQFYNRYGYSIVLPLLRSHSDIIYSRPLDTKKMAQFKFRMEHEIAYLINSFQNKGSNNEIEAFPYNSSFPFDGKLRRDSWFFESVPTYTYTPGPCDIEYVDEKNRRYMAELAEKEKLKTIGQLEEVIFSQERDSYADVLSETKPKKSSDTYPSSIFSSLCENRKFVPSLLFEGKGVSLENVSVVETRQETEKQAGERAIAKQRKEKETREREIALQKKREKARQLQLNESLIKLFEVGTGPISIRELQSLISQNVDINYQSKKDGYTALMLAVDRNDTRAVEQLLRSGANPLLTNRYGLKASDIAETHSIIYIQLKNAEESMSEKAVSGSGVSGLINFGTTGPGAKAASAAIQTAAEENASLKSGYS
ncbi:MAG: ankyrin repeat domain-containing protein [Gammaproteobacteria bacterium]|nr:ankyrin repeat domain-containing protein [Gammaproteobacteria bacterium]